METLQSVYAAEIHGGMTRGEERLCPQKVKELFVSVGQGNLPGPFEYSLGSRDSLKITALLL